MLFLVGQHGDGAFGQHVSEALFMSKGNRWIRSGGPPGRKIACQGRHRAEECRDYMERHGIEWTHAH